ncbi:MAG: hypothetical protein ACE5D8_08275 [Fidelibacterota bacterium]
MRIGFCLRTWKKRMQNGRPVRLAPSATGVSSVLIIFPDQLDEYRIAHHYFKSVEDSHPAVRFTFLLPGDSTPLHTTGMENGSIVLQEEDFDRWQLPSREFIDRLFAKPYDAIINLCTPEYLVAETIVCEAPVNLRLGFYSPRTSRYYDLTIERTGRLSLEKVYIQIQQLLGLQ